MDNLTDADGGPAFPFTWEDSEMGNRVHPGMTLRDYFAGQALPIVGGGYEPDDAAILAYQYADAMIARRTHSPKEA